MVGRPRESGGAGETLSKSNTRHSFFDSPDTISQAKIYFDSRWPNQIFSHCGLDLIQAWLSAISRRWSGGERGPVCGPAKKTLRKRADLSRLRKLSARYMNAQPKRGI